MKHLLLFLPILFVVSCSNVQKQQDTKGQNLEDVTDKTFEEIFAEIAPTDISENVFKLFGQDFAVVTAGNKSHFNSMTVAYGGFGIHLGLPSTMCFLRANRYTLEFIRGEQSYTMCWFNDEYKDAVLYFGSMSGRGTDKMANNPLSAVTTPNGNIAYKEAKLIVECKLIEITSVSPDDFYIEKGREFVEEGFNDAKDYHKLVFGEITKVWKRIN